MFSTITRRSNKMMNSTDGWDDDDVDDVDLEEDDEDIFMEDNVSTVPADQGTATGLSGVTMGPGLLVGRFTQMISQVVAPQDTPITSTTRSTQEFDAKGDGKTTPLQTTNGTLYSLMPVALTTSSIEDEGGWDDDLDAIDVDDDQGGWSHDDDDLDELEAEESQQEEADDHAQQQHTVDNLNSHPHPVGLRSAGNGEERNKSAGGWNNSLRLDDENEEQRQQDSARVAEPTAGVPAPPQLESNEFGGWDDPALDDLDQEVIQDNGLETTLPVNNSSVIPLVDSQGDPAIVVEVFADTVENYARVEPTNAVPLDTNGDDDNEQVTTEDGEPTEEPDGWGDSDLEGLDEFDQFRSPEPPPPPAASPLVDQVPPAEVPPVLQRDSTVAMASDQSETLGEESYPDEEHYGPVVDQLPPPYRAVPAGTESLMTQVRIEELDQDDNEVGEDTAPGEASEEAINRANACPVVVDHVPTISAGHRVRDSTLAVASQQSSTVMEDIWREDFAPNDEDYGPVVDQLPTTEAQTPSVKSLRSISSLAVQGVIAEEEDVDDEDVSERRSRVGIFSGASVADSLAVVAPIAENDEENTVGQTMDGVEGDTLHDDETVSNAPLTTDGNNSMAATREEPLVDHVPLQRGVNPIDASTLVLADPSEVSTVGDMTYEDMQYGPVVDHTPPPRPLSWSASGAASVVVAATKSECPDDLEDDMDGETYAMGTGDDAASLDTSLGDQNLADDQLVDHVPEGPGLRRINSASAIAEAQSVISTRDDEFGLVVDHTPILPIGTASLPRDSVGALATLSECETLRSEDIRSVPGSVLQRRVELYEIPVSSNVSRGDSTFAVKSVDESVDGDTIDEMPAVSEFGPVVDHLPSLGAPIPPSRGGSTAGALATLSEADFDGDTAGADADADGWEEDDIELQDGVTVGTASPDEEIDEFKEETPETRNKSVTFQNLEGAPGLPYSSVLSERMNQRVALPDAPFDGEEDSNVGRSTNGSISLEGSVECRACSETWSLDCPCIQRILSCDGDSGSAIVRKMSPDGIPVDIDYNKLLQDEVTKRVILEKEVEKYQHLINSLQSCVSETTVGKIRAQGEIKRLEALNDALSGKLQGQENQSMILQRQVDELQTQITTSENSLTYISSTQQNSTDKEMIFQATIEELKAERESVLVEASQEINQLRGDLEAEIARLRDENDSMRRQSDDEKMKLELLQAQYNASSVSEIKLREEIAEAGKLRSQIETQFSESLKEKDSLSRNELEAAQSELRIALQEIKTMETQMDQLSTKAALVEKDLRNANEKLSELSREKLDFTEKERNYRAEIGTLQQMVAEATSSGSLVEHFKAKIESLEAEVKDKAAKVASLNDKLKSKEVELTEAEANIFAQIKESARLVKRHELEIAKLNKEFEAAGQDYIVKLESMDAAVAEGRERLAGVLHELHSVSEVKDKLKSRVQDLLTVAQEKEALESIAHRLDAEKAQLLDQVGQQERSLSQVIMERDLLRATVDAHANKVEQMQQELTSLFNLKNDFASVEGKLREVEKEKEQHIQSLAVCQERIKSVEDEAIQTRKENQFLRSQSHEVIENLKARVNEYEIASLQNEKMMKEMQTTISSTSAQLVTISKERDELVIIRSELTSAIDVLKGKEKEAEDLAKHSQMLKDQLSQAIAEQKASLAQLCEREEMEAQLRADIDSLLSERDAILGTMRQHEEDSEEMLVQLGLNKEQMDTNEKEIAALHDALRASETSNVRITDSLRSAEECIRKLEQQVLDLMSQKDDKGMQGDVETCGLRNEVEKLTVENADLKQQIEDLSSAIAYTDEEVHTLKVESEALREQLQQNESRIQHGAKFEESCKIWEANCRESEERLAQLTEVYTIQKLEVERLVNCLHETDVSARKFQQIAVTDSNRIQELERTVAQLEEGLRDKNDALNEASHQIEYLRHKSTETDEKVISEMSRGMNQLRLQLEESQHESRNRQIQSKDLENALGTAVAELQQTKDILSTTEQALLKLELDMGANSNEAAIKAYYETLLAETKEALVARDNFIQQVEMKRAALEDQVKALTEKLAKGQENASLQNGEQRYVTESDQEISLLKSKVSHLNVEREAVLAESSSRDESLRKEMTTLRDEVQHKINKVTALEQQVDNLSMELSTAKSVMILKEEELQRLSLELEENRVAQLEATQKVTSKVLESNTSTKEVDNTENMRNLVISLSHALEKSESQRADAIDRLLRERKTNADSLKRLGESVKRFYSTLQRGSP